MDYIRYMRSMIGNKPMFLVGGGTLIHDQHDRLLLIKRTDNNTWGIPGGSCELGETFEEAAIREAFEETGLTVRDLNLFNVYSGKDMHHIYPNGDEVYNAICIFETSVYEGGIVNDGVESSDVRFFPLSELPEEINPPDQVVLDEWREHENNRI